jgi:hypothetical protein
METTCIQCNQIKIKANPKTYKNGTTVYHDQNGRRWAGSRCPDCHSENRKKKRLEKGGTNLSEVSCKSCPIIFLKKTWSHVYCDVCSKKRELERMRKYNRSRIKPSVMTCKICEKRYTRTESNRNVYCSEDCYKSALPKKDKKCVVCCTELVGKQLKYCSEHKPRYEKKKPKKLKCKTCGKGFSSTQPSAKYCKKTCSKSYIEAKRFRRSIRRSKHQLISKEFKSEILEIYQNRPEGYHVDHIIPLKGENVCGLHVPWNLQYLIAKDNIKKGNKF